MKDSPLRECEIVYVRQGKERGWKWRSLADEARAAASDVLYELFYECVVAARKSGYAPFPELKCR
jgi:hypothetical protein